MTSEIRNVVTRVRAEIGEYKRSYAEVSSIAKTTGKDIEAAAQKASKAQADAAGRVRVAEAQLAQARQKHAAGSSQVVAAEERLAKARRDEAAASTAAAAAERQLDAAQRGMAGRHRAAASAVTELSTGLGAAAGQFGLVTSSAGPAGVAVAAVAGGAVVAGKAVLSLADAAGQLEQAAGASENVFRGYTQAVEDYASTASQAVGLSETAYLELNNVVAAQLKNLGYGLAQASASSINLTERAADLAAQFGGDTRTAMEAFTSALRGETDPIERYGISITAAKVAAKALELGLWDGKGAVDSFGKAAATEALILEQSTDAAGQFGKEVTTYQGQLQRLTAELTNLKTSIGNGVLPVATDFATVLNYTTQQVSELQEKVAGLGSPLGSLPGWLDTAYDAAKAALNPVGALIGLTRDLADSIRSIPPEAQTATLAQRQLTKDTNDLAYAQGQAGQRVAETTEETTALIAGTDEFAKATEDARAAIDRYAPGLRDLSDAQVFDTAISQDLADAYKEQAAALEDLVGGVRDSVSDFTSLTGIYKQVTEDGEKAFNADRFIAEQEKRNKAVRDWKKNLETLADRGLSRKIIQNLESAGVEGSSALVDSLANHTTDKELAKIGRNWSFGQTLGKQIGREIAVAMVDAMDGQIDGLLNGNPIKIPADADMRKAEKKVSDFHRAVAHLRTELPVGANTAQALADARAAQRAINELNASISVSYQGAYGEYVNKKRGGNAAGGAITGPGTGTSDSIPSWLSNGEHVWTAAEVKAAGGQDAMYRMRAIARAGQLPRFASGGATEDELAKRLAELQRQFRADIRRRDFRTGITDSLSGAYSGVDTLLDLSREQAVSKGGRASLAAAARAAEPALRRLYEHGERLEKALDKARQRADELAQVRDQVSSTLAGGFDFGQSVADATTQFDRPDGTIGTAVDVRAVTAGAVGYARQLRDFAARVERLRKLGMPAVLLQQIIGLGPDQGIPTADAWIAGGKDEIAKAARAYRGIESAADLIGTDLTKAMFAGGVDGADALVDGLESREKDIEREIRKIARMMERALRDALEMRSPSKKAQRIADDYGKSIADRLPQWEGRITTAAQAMVAGMSQPASPGGYRTQVEPRGGDTYEFVLDSHAAATSMRGYMDSAVRELNRARAIRGRRRT